MAETPPVLDPRSASVREGFWQAGQAVAERSRFIPGRSLLYLLATVFCLGIVIFVALLFGDASKLLERLGMERRISGDETLLPLGGEEALGGEPGVARADDARASGNLREAMELYERALAMGGDTVVMRKLFDAALLLREREKAEEVLGLLAFRGVPEEILDALRGFVHLRAGDLAGAEALFAKDPLSPEHAYGMTIAAILKGEHERAKESLAVVERSSDPLLAHAAKAVRGAYDEFALFEDGKPVHRSTLLARAFAEAGQCPAAQVLLQGVLAEDPDYRDAWIVQGYCSLALEDVLGALAAFERAYALDPEKAETQYFLGIANERAGHLPEARTFLEYALLNRFQPELALRERIAAVAIAEGDYAAAADHERAILALTEEKDPLVYRALVTLLLEHLGDPEGAGEVAREAREELGDVPLVLDLLGWTAFERGSTDEAAAFLMVAVQQDPSLASAWYHKGLLAERLGDATDARESYRKAYELSLGSDAELATAAAERHNALVSARGH